MRGLVGGSVVVEMILRRCISLRFLNRSDF